MKTLMKSMMAGALGSLAAVAASGSANATLCGTTTLDTMLGATFSCTVGDKTFSNFLYNPDGLLGAVPASNVGVSVDNFFPGLQGLVFNANWDNTGSTTSKDVFLTFTVSAPALTIADYHQALDGVVGTVSDEATLTGFTGAPLSLTTTGNNSGSINFGPVQSLTVQDDIGISGLSKVSSVHKDFSQVPGPIVGASLPGLVAACGGLLALARRRRQSA